MKQKYLQIYTIVFVVLATLLLFTSCGRRYKSLPPSLQNKILFRLDDKREEGQYWLTPHFVADRIVTTENTMELAGNMLYIDKGTEIFPRDWRMTLKLNDQYDGKLNIRCVDTKRQLYRISYLEVDPESDRARVHKKDRYAGLFIAMDINYTVPNLGANDQVLPLDVNMNGIKRRAGVYYQTDIDSLDIDFTNRGNFEELEVLDVDAFVRSSTIRNYFFDEVYDIYFPELDKKIPHRYVVVPVRVKNYRNYELFVFGKFTDQYSLLLHKTIYTNEGAVELEKFEVNNVEGGIAPFPLDRQDAMGKYFEENKQVGKTNGGFKVTFSMDGGAAKRDKETKRMVKPPATTYTNTFDYVLLEDAPFRDKSLLGAITWKLVSVSKDKQQVQMNLSLDNGSLHLLTRDNNIQEPTEISYLNFK